jgi:hypothetical protein
MPIRRDLRQHYRAEWAAFSLWVREVRAGNRCEFCGARNHQPHPVTGSRVVLTVAHLDQDCTHRDPDRCAALCQRCHNRHDAAHRAASRRRTRNARLGTKDLFDTHPP